MGQSWGIIFKKPLIIKGIGLIECASSPVASTKNPKMEFLSSDFLYKGYEKDIFAFCNKGSNSNRF